MRILSYVVYHVLKFHDEMHSFGWIIKLSFKADVVRKNAKDASVI